MASAPHVLRVALAHAAEGPSSHVLVAVSPSKQASPASLASQSLDLELLATDDQKAYVMTLSHARLARYRNANTLCADADWEDALKALLLPDHPIGCVEATARIADDEDKPTGDDRSYLFIDVMRAVSGNALTESLGTLKLRKSNKAEASIELFDWCVESVRERDRLEGALVELRREFDSLKALVAEETAKIRELARSKHEFEASHDSWLKDLLNEKKVRIRMQEQLLATAHVDPDKLAAATAAATASKPRHGRVGASKKGKRKAEGFHADSGQDSDREADKMDTDEDQAPDRHDEEMDEADQATTDSETASEPEPNSEPESLAKDKGTRVSPGAAASSSGKSGHNLREKKKKAVINPDESEDEAPSRKKSTAHKKAALPVYDPDDDESTASE